MADGAVAYSIILHANQQRCARSLCIEANAAAVCLEALAANPAAGDVHNIQTAMNYRAAIHHIDIGRAQRRSLHIL